MTVNYLDTSVLLRIAFKQPGALPMKSLKSGVSSELLLSESLRTLDRLRFSLLKEPEEVMLLKENVFRLVNHIELILLSRQILRRVASPFSTPLGTLDAIHLSTAILWREKLGKPISFFTHDRELEIAARAEGFATS